MQEIEESKSRIRNFEEHVQEEKIFKVFSEDVIRSEDCPASIIQSLTCPICLMILPMPHYQCSQCNNQFCTDCLDDWIKRSAKCVFKCQNGAFKLVKRSNTYNAMIQIFKIKCKACSENIFLSKFKIHQTKQCPQALQKCQYKQCTQKILRKNLLTHKQSCQHRLTECQYCHSMMKWMNLEQHLQLCEERKLKCTNNLCNQILPIGKMKIHFQCCPFKVIQCQWCEKQFLNSNMQAHLNQCEKRKIECYWCKVTLLMRQFVIHKQNCSERMETCPLCTQQIKSVKRREHREDCIFNSLIQLKQDNIRLNQKNVKLQVKLTDLEQYVSRSLQDRQHQTVKTLQEMKDTEKKDLVKDLERINYSLKSLEKLKKEELQSHLKYPHISISWCPVCKELQKKFKVMFDPLLIKRKQVMTKLDEIDRFSVNLSKIHVK